jgi:small-conductance mechanosensitive channel
VQGLPTGVRAVPLAASQAASQAAATIERYDFLKDLPWLEIRYFGNSVYAYILSLATFVALWAALHALRLFVLKRIERVAETRDSDAWRFVRSLAQTIMPFLFPLAAAYLALQRLHISPLFVRALRFFLITMVTIQVVRLASQMVGFLILRARALGRADDPMAQNTGHNLVVLARTALWVAAVLFLLDNAGFNVSTFIAGLGIGGVAIALAAQAILGDTFSSFAIALDKPFEVGDQIVVDKLTGTVEHIGLKTTRVRSVGGELLVFANSDLTKSRIQNFKRMNRKRVSFRVWIDPATSNTLLKRVPEVLAEAVTSAPSVTLDKAYFDSFGEKAALAFEVVYYVEHPENADSREIQQGINYRVREGLEKAGIAMAFPG